MVITFFPCCLEEKYCLNSQIYNIKGEHIFILVKSCVHLCMNTVVNMWNCLTGQRRIILQSKD